MRSALEAKLTKVFVDAFWSEFHTQAEIENLHDMSASCIHAYSKVVSFDILMDVPIIVEFLQGIQHLKEDLLQRKFAWIILTRQRYIFLNGVLNEFNYHDLAITVETIWVVSGHMTQFLVFLCENSQKIRLLGEWAASLAVLLNFGSDTVASLAVFEVEHFSEGSLSKSADKLVSLLIDINVVWWLNRGYRCWWSDCLHFPLVVLLVGLF